MHRSSTLYSDRRVRWLGTALILAALCVFAEGAAFVFYRTVILTNAPFLAYTPPRDITRVEFERYRRIRDAPGLISPACSGDGNCALDPIGVGVLREDARV